MKCKASKLSDKEGFKSIEIEETEIELERRGLFSA